MEKQNFNACRTHEWFEEQMEEELKGMRNNKVNIDFLKEQVSKLQTDVEKLIRNGSGH